ncbi:MAG: hypothetical protein ACTS73_09130 [Arsenophonus sp. NEOnobi-MAG3]
MGAIDFNKIVQIRYRKFLNEPFIAFHNNVISHVTLTDTAVFNITNESFIYIYVVRSQCQDKVAIKLLLNSDRMLII